MVINAAISLEIDLHRLALMAIVVGALLVVRVVIVVVVTLVQQ